MTFTDFINDSHIYVILFWVFFQPFDDFEACFYAAVGEFRTEQDCHTDQTDIFFILKNKFEHKSYNAFIFSVEDLYLLFDY